METTNGHDMGVVCVAKLSPFMFISGSNDKPIKLWNIALKLRCVRTFKDDSIPSCVAKISNIGTTFVGGLCNGVIKLWDVNSKNDKCIDIFKKHGTFVTDIAKMAPHVFVSCSAGSIKLWNIGPKNHGCIKTIDGFYDQVTCVIKMSAHTFISGSCDRTIKLWAY